MINDLLVQYSKPLQLGRKKLSHSLSPRGKISLVFQQCASERATQEHFPGGSSSPNREKKEPLKLNIFYYILLLYILLKNEIFS